MTESTYEIHNLLVLSSSHMAAEDADLVTDEVFPGKGGDESSLLVYCGALGDESFAVNSARAAGYSDAFIQALELARSLRCRYLLFDSAGPAVESLPTFDW